MDQPSGLQEIHTLLTTHLPLQTAPSDPPFTKNNLLEIKKESAPHLSML